MSASPSPEQSPIYDTRPRDSILSKSLRERINKQYDLLQKKIDEAGLSDAIYDLDVRFPPNKDYLVVVAKFRGITE